MLTLFLFFLLSISSFHGREHMFHVVEYMFHAVEYMFLAVERRN